jgi:hypothetical protein
MREDWTDAMKVDPLAVTANYADQLIDLCGPIGDKWK